MTGRWPGPAREPLPVGLITEQDIEDALRLAGSHMTEPEDPAFNVVAFGALCAARAALIECGEVLENLRIDRGLHGQDDDRREWERVGREYVAQKVARRSINELRKWLP
ncbi:hypothetical protein [Actinoplanes rectilineatus]|uniref:hypothetical protein n=1 Tax=Actinoplanes rectilineatus TaxID=113571 RepID=UPI0005F27733|nr:hypothetical protein [Actinoplanes rectilineatus]